MSRLLLLQGCGFEPLYGNTGATGTGVSSLASAIYVEPISERIGYELRNDLLDRLDGTSNAGGARYRLKLSYHELEEPGGVPAQHLDHALQLHADRALRSRRARRHRSRSRAATSAAFAAYNVAASPYLYSTVAAQRDAKNRAANDIAERIRIELAVYLRQVAQDTR